MNSIQLLEDAYEVALEFKKVFTTHDSCTSKLRQGDPMHVNIGSAASKMSSELLKTMMNT